MSLCYPLFLVLMSDSYHSLFLFPFHLQGYERDEIDQRAEYQEQRGSRGGHSHGGFGGFSGFGGFH